jgi:hypothetical protein
MVTQLKDIPTTAASTVQNGRIRGRMSGLLMPVAYMSLALLALVSCRQAPPTPSQRTFTTPEEAVRVLIATVIGGNMDELVGIFGPEGKELAASSDPKTARQNREVFTVAAAESWQLVDHGANGKELVIGNEQWPFPIPLVKEGNVWRFDTAAGKEEVLARRIGRNELAVIQISRAYLTAQRLYAAQGHDGKPAGIYAHTFRSDPGKQNGLYWPTTRGQKRSPLGDLIAEAGQPTPAPGQKPGQPSPFHGYYFRILTAQGADAAGGAKDYIVKGEMSGGFALVAWPAQYDATGVMTFLINQDGVVHEKDLGPETDRTARAMTLYNPDKSWKAVQ